MLIYGQILGDDDCDFNVTDTTENFLIYFFGFYNHNITDNLYSFLNELNIKNILNDYPESEEDFKINGNNALDVYNICDRRTADIGIVLPNSFQNEEDAIEWFNQKLKESDYINKSDIHDTLIIDADRFMSFLAKNFKYENKENQIKSDLERGMLELKEALLRDFPDEKSKNTIDKLFKKNSPKF